MATVIERLIILTFGHCVSQNEILRPLCEILIESVFFFHFHHMAYKQYYIWKQVYGIFEVLIKTE